MKMVAEGVATTVSARHLARRQASRCPSRRKVYQVLYRDKPPQKAIDDLMSAGAQERVTPREYDEGDDRCKIKAIAVLRSAPVSPSAPRPRRRWPKAREKDPQYQYNLGLFYLNSSNVDEAIKYLNQGRSLWTRAIFLAWNTLGLAHRSRETSRRPSRPIRKCLEINPQFTEAHNNLGTVYQEMGSVDKAEAEFTRRPSTTRPIEPRIPDYNLARLYFHPNGSTRPTNTPRSPSSSSPASPWPTT